ncbi:hypothetical protein [Bacillus sp. 37MA]|uniref:hypothetical protein n=1 Tax=Bacillus sp. 37MA TaxID=1132442 RepID=UPI0003790AA2
MIAKIAELYDVTTDYLITGKESTNVKTDISKYEKEMKEAPEDQLEEIRQIWEVIKKRGLNK